MANNSWIKLTSFGGANQVTASCHMITVMSKKEEVLRRYLVDCGLPQGKDFTPPENISSYVGEITAVFLTHAHLDHSGRLPYLYKLGYRKPIYSTEGTKKLAAHLLLDSARIQEEEYANKLKRNGKKLLDLTGIKPLYSEHDAENVMNYFREIERNEEVVIDEYLKVKFYNAGHMLGSASIMFMLSNGEEDYKIYFSGDIGQNNPILKRRIDSPKNEVDFVVMESTYAGREHPERETSWMELRSTVASTILNGGNVVFPAFAVGRTQELLYLLYKDMKENDDWVTKVLKSTPIFVDCVLAINATEVFKEMTEEFTLKMREMLKEDENPFAFHNLHISYTPEQSMAIAERKEPSIIFSASGMCVAGRILWHLKNNLRDPKSTIIFTGYQSEGTLGRLLVDGEKIVNLHGCSMMVKAKIEHIGGFSAHADENELLKWLSKIEKGYVLFLAHGNPADQEQLKQRLVDEEDIFPDDIELLSPNKEYYLYKGQFYEKKFTPPNLLEKDGHNKKFDKKTCKKILRLRELLQTINEDHDVLRIAELKNLELSVKEDIKILEGREKKRTKHECKPNKTRKRR